MKHNGLHPHRLQKSADNPEEVRFAKAWQGKQDHGSILAYLLWQGTQGGRPPDPSDRDIAVAATVVQWFGSPVGQAFLAELGYERKP